MKTADFAPAWSVTPRTAVLGDIGGHAHLFEEVLEDLGVDLRLGAIPEGLVIIQVGDLVHKGPASDRCVAIADDLLYKNPSRYIQLVGNHEAHYLGGPHLYGRSGVEDVSVDTQEMITNWWDTGSMRLATAVEVPGDDRGVLVTHGGLTAGLWRELGRPDTAMAAAHRINHLWADTEKAFRPGALMTGVVDYAAGVTCSRTGAELAASWLEEVSMPFNQVHGHEAAWWWPDNDWHTDCPENVKATAMVDPIRRFCRVDVGEGWLLSVDWTLGLEVPVGFSPQPLILH